MRNPQHQGMRDQARNIVHGAIQQMFSNDNSLFGKAAHIAFIKDVLQKHGHAAASGVFAVLSRSDIHFERNVNEAFFGGLLRGFLFQNEIDWTASAHRKVLDDLEAQYKQRLEDQEARLQHLEAENLRLNGAHDATLKAKSDGLDELSLSKASVLDELHTAKETALNELYAAKDKAFADLATKHEANLKNIEDTFHNKLALQKPIDYWREKKVSHVKLAKRFAWASGIVLVVFGVGLGFLIHWAFGNLEANENPKHWQVGVTIIAAFFVIWIVRLLVRMFLSHQHLAADAAERVTMVQTYLSLSLEGQGVAPADRSVILQQLFKSASDGLVKDDGAPPTALEWFSRPK
ncbi:MAG: DUF6161 domain-containing protein [Prosthecobacter sp.]|uniref:DUF6161 domain-containing protein n=1 Tax=Prosthecobacter sp. TaxID=1965333 RepID=UPI0039034ED6